MLRLAELLPAVSLATDLADDAPFGSALGDAVTVVDFAQMAGFAEEDVQDAYYLALLHHIGCTAAVLSQARASGGDDVSARRWYSEADYADRPQIIRLAATRVTREWGLAARSFDQSKAEPVTWREGVSSAEHSPQAPIRSVIGIAPWSLAFSAGRPQDASTVFNNE
jgi:hypothetical protein